MIGEFKLLWATDVGAQLEAEHIGMEVFASKSAAEESELVKECHEKAIPIIVFVPNMPEAEVVASAGMLEVFNDINAAIRNGEPNEDKEA